MKNEFNCTCYSWQQFVRFVIQISSSRTSNVSTKTVTLRFNKWHFFVLKSYTTKYSICFGSSRNYQSSESFRWDKFWSNMLENQQLLFQFLLCWKHSKYKVYPQIQLFQDIKYWCTIIFTEFNKYRYNKWNILSNTNLYLRSI